MPCCLSLTVCSQSHLSGDHWLTKHRRIVPRYTLSPHFCIPLSKINYHSLSPYFKFLSCIYHRWVLWHPTSLLGLETSPNWLTVFSKQQCTLMSTSFKTACPFATQRLLFAVVVLHWHWESTRQYTCHWNHRSGASEDRDHQQVMPSRSQSMWSSARGVSFLTKLLW